MKTYLRKFARCFAIGLFLLAFFPGCSKHDAAGGKESDIDYWTCTMHPSVHAKDPGNCPICAMDLVPVLKRDTPAGAPAASKETNSSSEFRVPMERQQQIGVTYATVETKPLHHTIRAVGKVAPDTQRVWRVVARAGGYVQELGVSAPGEIVKKGQVLMTLYSPELLTTQRELIDLLRMRDNSPKGAHSAHADAQSLIESAKRRLRLWNITEEQVAKIEQSRHAEESLPILAKMDGIVQTLPVTQGMTIAPGNTLVDVADLSVVWVWGEFYQEELPMLQVGQEVTVTSDSYPGEKFKGQLSLVDPFINDAKRTGRVRLDIQNPELKLKPDMYVDVLLEMDMGRSLVVPVSAIMPTGKRNIAFVDKGEGKLEPRFLELGGKYGNVYAVKSGLKEGERVVASANFLIDAESKIQGALKSW
ncbi:MAG: efflux RND transporter periplasmic adaptor subunit [Chthoniobacterales bacterium]|nr:efflux RND transporter periplasmic adaptor subunit [Chthoniobacterales bacterium]